MVAEALDDPGERPERPAWGDESPPLWPLESGQCRFLFSSVFGRRLRPNYVADVG